MMTRMAPLFLLLVAAASAQRFLGETQSLKDECEKCYDDGMACRVFATSKLTDNSACMDQCFMDPNTPQAKACKVIAHDKCFYRGILNGDDVKVAEKIPMIDVTNTFTSFKKLFENNPSVLNMFGVGDKQYIDNLKQNDRFRRLNPQDFGARACQGWLQIRDVYNKLQFPAKYFLYREEERACQFFDLPKGADLKDQVAKPTTGAPEIDDLVGESYVGNLQCFDGMKFEKRSDEEYTDAQIACEPTFQEKVPQAACYKVLSTKRTDLCRVRIGYPSRPAGCEIFTNEQLAKCYRTPMDVKEVRGLKPILTLGDDIQEFLEKTGNQWRFGTEKNTPQRMGLDPTVTGAQACFSLMQATNNYNKRIIPNASTFFYDADKKTCNFFDKSVKISVKPITGVVDESQPQLVLGPAFCKA